MLLEQLHLTASPVHFVLPHKDIPIYFLMILQRGNPQLYCCTVSSTQLRLDGYRAREPVCKKAPLLLENSSCDEAGYMSEGFLERDANFKGGSDGLWANPLR